MYQWLEWINIQAPEEEVTNIYWLIIVLSGTKKDGKNMETNIRSWTKPVNYLNDLFEKR